MWAFYCKTFIPVQCLILAVCAVIIILFEVPARGLLVPVLVMETAGIFGARMAVRAQRFTGGDKLPLSR